MPDRQPTSLDTALIVLFLIGIYLGVTPVLVKGVPMPAAPAGVAGALLLVRNADRIERRHVIALLAVVTLYLISIVCAEDLRFFGERAKGFLQVVYSLLIAYGLFITLLLYDRNVLARIFLVFCLAMVVGAALENYTDFRAVSDAVRARLYDQFLYVADERDFFLSGAIRPKFFTSEPSALAFSFTLYGFCWYALSSSRIKIITYSALLVVGYKLMHSPTVMVGFVALVPYDLLTSSLRARAAGLLGTVLVATRLILLAAIGAGALIFAASDFLGERYEQIRTMQDPSFLFRVVGPARVAEDTLLRHPIAGAGLTGEEFIENRVMQVYASLPTFDERWVIKSASEVLTNYFWLHWIYLGLVGGVIIALALTWWIRVLGTTSLLFTWGIWVIFGQASGAYVSPKTWTVLMLACAISILAATQARPFPRMTRPVPVRGSRAVGWIGAPAAGK